MNRILASPGRYVQGANALQSLHEYLGKLGSKALVVVDPFVVDNMQEVLSGGLADFPNEMERFGGESSRPEVDRLVEQVKSVGADVVVGVGGGKTVDTAKAVAHYAGLPVAIVPTTASTDAPCSALSVLYTPEGVFDSYLFLPKNPELVLMDTQIVAEAPVRFLVSGIGDALATHFEAEACAHSHAANVAGGAMTEAARSLAELCFDTLMEYGYQAKLAAERKVVTPALERVVEANTLLSGLGFESGGLAAAHAIHNGFTALEATNSLYHGEKVAFSTLVQMVLEDRPAHEIDEVMEFCVMMGLPVTLEELNLPSPSKEDLMKVAEAATVKEETIHNMPFPVTAELVYNAIVATDALGRDYL
ncbi:MAG: glycerol dehydrogenase [Firmicutes bacterium]|nr:glycerol dehydrogenase [Bacillota bacterium]